VNLNEKRLRRSCWLMLALGASLIMTSAGNAATVTVNSGSKLQTWTGWEASVEQWHRPNNYASYGNSYLIPSNYSQERLDTIVNDLGLTALRFELLIHMSGGREGLEPTNDNSDPLTLDSSKILWNYIDPYIREFVIPFRDRVVANGDKFYLVLSSTAWDAWQWNSPNEFAEIYMAGLDRLKNKYGVTPDAIIIFNEPDGGSGAANPTRVLNELNAVVTRMDQDPQYSSVTIRYPAASTISAAHSWLDSMESHSAATKLLARTGQFDFHGYGGFSASALNSFRSRAKNHGGEVIMGEWWFLNNPVRDNANDIITSLTQADATIYQGSSDLGLMDVGPETSPKRGVKGPKYSTFRQFYRFIRPGDRRISVSSNDTALKVAGFENPQGRHTVVVRNSSGSSNSVTINGLAAGTYGVSVTSASQDGAEQPTVVVASGGSLNYPNIPADSIVTFYGRNQQSGSLQFSVGNYLADEHINGASSQLAVMVTRRNGANGAVSVQYGTSSSSASGGSDYTSTSGTLNFADGETTRTFTINILNNTPGSDEGDEFLNLSLSNPGGGANLGSLNQARLTIRDPEGPGFDNIAPRAPGNLTAQ
jgi:hypothetical protein